MIAGYLSDALDTNYRAATIAKALERLRTIDFQTIVVQGTSGLLLGPILAYLLDKSLCVVRKREDGSHSFNRVEGNPVGKCLIVDDFIASGCTVNEIRTAMREVHENSCFGIYTYYGGGGSLGYFKTDTEVYPSEIHNFGETLAA